MKFNRHNLEDSKKTLNRLRRAGKARLQTINFYYPMENQAFRHIKKYIKEGSVFLDAGCGESPETIYAKRMGCESYGMDIFSLDASENNDYNHALKAKDLYKKEKIVFLKQDICEEWDIDKKIDFMICSGVLPLLQEEEKIMFFCQIWKNLGIDGIVSFFYFGMSDCKIIYTNDLIDIFKRNYFEVLYKDINNLVVKKIK